MLYAKIYITTLATIYLIGQSFGGDYYVSSGADGASCTNLGPDEVCNFHCDEKKWQENIIDCGHANECNVYCSRTKCFETSTINAMNTNNLNIYSSGSGRECFKNATINTPNNGNAIFSNIGTGNNAFKEMTVNCGANTGDIIIDCIGVDNVDECKNIQINAETAQYLEINVDDGILGPGTINCPIDSTYNGPKMSSCIIDVSGGGTLDTLTINAPNGVPNGLQIEISPDTTFISTQLICSSGIVQDGAILSPDNDCWNPVTTTVNPTISPTAPPTTTSTIASTAASTTTSTATSTMTSATRSTTTSTTDTTESLTMEPSVAPTRRPTHDPTNRPSVAPTRRPTHDPTNRPTASTIASIATSTTTASAASTEAVRTSTTDSLISTSPRSTAAVSTTSTTTTATTTGNSETVATSKNDRYTNGKLESMPQRNTMNPTQNMPAMEDDHDILIDNESNGLHQWIWYLIISVVIVSIILIFIFVIVMMQRNEKKEAKRRQHHEQHVHTMSKSISYIP